jgi:MFS family permease
VYGAFPVVALAATTALETGERTSLAQAVDGIQETFHVTDTWLGLLPAAMTVVGVLGSFPFGHLADRIRRTAMLAVAMAVWTVCMTLNAVAGSYAFLFVARLGVGVVEANGPATVSLMSDYYPVRIRAKMMGLYGSGGLIGVMIGLGLGGVLVDQFSWRAAFWMWIPFGILVALVLTRLPEPRRGDQDVDFHADLDAMMDSVDAGDVAGRFQLPPPPRVGDADYTRMGWREAFHEVVRIRSMWFGVLALTISQSLLNGLGFWGVEYFKRVFGLSASEAGGFAVLFGVGAAFGVVGGGFVADRILRRGIVNARVYVVAFSSMAATAVFLPAFISTSLAVTLPLFVIGGLFLTLPLAPADAMLSDVVVAPLRGRASAMRSVVRSLSGLAPLIIGWLSDLTDLRVAFILFTPLYAVGGVIMLAAAKSYPSDVAFVVAESRRIHEDAQP